MTRRPPAVLVAAAGAAPRIRAACQPLPPLARRDEAGFSSCSTRPSHRAVAPTPPEQVAASSSLRHPVLPSPCGRGLGLRDASLSGPPLRSLSLRPGNSLTIRPMAWSMGFRVSVSLYPAIQVTGLWLLPRRDCLPLNASAFSGRTVDHQLERGGLLDREVGRFRPLEDLVHVVLQW